MVGLGSLPPGRCSLRAALFTSKNDVPFSVVRHGSSGLAHEAKVMAAGELALSPPAPGLVSHTRLPGGAMVTSAVVTTSVTQRCVATSP